MRYFLLVFLISFSSCSKEVQDVNTSPLVGSWSEVSGTDEIDFSQELVYNFKHDFTVSVTRLVVEQETDRILGYRYFSEGLYSIEGNKLNLIDMKVFEHDDSKGSFSSFDELISSGFYGYESVQFIIENNGTQLRFIYGPCNANANCLSTKILEKK